MKSKDAQRSLLGCVRFQNECKVRWLELKETHDPKRRVTNVQGRYFGAKMRSKLGCASNNKNASLFRLGWLMAVDHNLWDPEARIADCDRDGVDVQVLSTVPVMFSYWAKPEHTLDLSMILNDHIADILTRFPKRFTGLCTVPMQAPKLAIRELERAMKCGFDGVEIATHINHWNLDDEPLMDFYAAAEELGASIFVHPWDIMAPERMERYWLKWLVGMPAETSLAMASLLMGGVIERFPKLKFAFAHGGGAIGATIGRIKQKAAFALTHIFA